MKNTVIGRRIRRLREARGLSRPGLATTLGVDPTSVSGWENGKYLPSDRHRGGLARALHIDLEALFDEHGVEPSKARAAIITDSQANLTELLMAQLASSRLLRALRIAAPYSTHSHV